MYSIKNSSFPLDMNVNVSIKVLNGKGEISQHIKKHNKATVNMTTGIIKFLRGEFSDTNLSVDSIGHDVDSAKNYIPSYIGIGNTGTGGGTLIRPIYNEIDYAQYSDQSLRQEIFKYYTDANSNVRENHRFAIQRSTSGDSPLSDTFSLKLSTTINFSNKFEFYTNYSDKRISYIGEVIGANAEEDENAIKNPKIIITEIGLFSGDVDDLDSKLLARMLLDEESPLIIDSTSTVIINWVIGIYSIDDMMLRKDFTDYNYTENERVFTEIIWETE